MSEGNEWQPIETAPKDGTRVDLWTACERYTSCRFNAVAHRWEYWGLGGFDTMAWCKVEPAPTHWMPLPAPPLTERSNQGDQ